MLLRRATLPLIAFLLLAAPAAAQVSDADRATARMLAQQGQEALESQDWAVAAERFARADALVHAPTLMLGQARAEVGRGRWIAALELYSRILREGVPAGSPAPWGKALQDAQKELAAFEPRVPAAVIELKGAGAATAKVSIDGTPVPAAAIGVNRPVDPGKRTLRAEAEGYAPVEVVMTFTERKVEKVTLQIDQPRATPSDASPPAPPPAAPQSSPLKTIGFVGIGVGGAGLIMGAVTGAMALSKHGQLAQTCPNGHCTGQQSAIDSYNLVGNLSTAGFVAGGILAATGVVLVIVAPKDPAPKQAWLAPTIGAGYAGLQGMFR
jgi:hypothetical protein